MCFYLICLAGFSYGLGADKFTYMDEFEDYPSDFSEIGEYIYIGLMYKGQMPLWTIVNLLCKAIFNSFYAVQLLESAAINITVCYLVSKYTHRYFLFLLIYFFSLQYFIFNTEVMREGFAMAFVLWGIHGWMSGKRWIYFVTLPIGLLFHVSALIVLLFPFAKFKISWKTLYIAFALTFALWILSDQLLARVLALVFGGEGAFVKKIMYYSLQASSFFGYARYVLTYLVFPFIIMYSFLLIEPSDEQRGYKEKMIAFMVILAIPASSVVGFMRFYNYVQIFYLIMLADFVYMLFRYKQHFIIRLGTLTGTSLLIIIFLYLTHYKTTDTYFYDYFYPYTCILDEDKDVFIREIAHQEAVTVEIEDNNVRDID